MLHSSNSRTVWRHSALRACVLLEELGGDVDAFLDAFDLSLNQLLTVGFRVQTNVFNLMLAQCQIETGHEDFGVLAGQTIPITNSALGVAVRASANALEGINRFKKYAPVIESGTVFTIKQHNGTHIVTIRGWNSQWNPAMQDALVSSVCLAAEHLTPKDCKPRYLKLLQTEPTNPATWYDCLSKRIEWGAQDVEIAWDSEALLHPRLLADESTALLNDALMEPQLQQVVRASLYHRVESQISQHMKSGIPTPDLVASDLSMGTRTLQRLLKEDGTSFKEILTLLRQEHAKSLLDTREPIAQIASRLGYEDPATFSKAFKAWFGLSPSDYLADKKNT
ncbi:MAG: helix-turn-helix domain-containing protein [Luminiphilus sp.]|nr:helix-turn-helix domain-containing protein [Luminiphilus sp.]